jgi:hypothetical protein
MAATEMAEWEEKVCQAIANGNRVCDISRKGWRARAKAGAMQEGGAALLASLLLGNTTLSELDIAGAGAPNRTSRTYIHCHNVCTGHFTGAAGAA